jgi:hypothetical protein
MGDRSIAKQLLSGFYQIEMNQWRWTAQEFSVALRPPPLAEERGARLILSLFLPQGHIEELGAITLDAEVEGCSLGPETFREPGMHLYSRELAADLLATSILPVRFTLDKVLPPSHGEVRRLGAVVTVVELKPR